MEFYYDTYDLLMRHESQNMILLGNIIIGHEGKDKTDWRDPAKWLMATVSNEKGIQLTALMTPPHNITLYATDNIIDPEAINCLIDGLEGYDIPGVLTEKTLAEYFAREYTARKGLTYKVTMDQRIYELTEVNPEVKLVWQGSFAGRKRYVFFPVLGRGILCSKQLWKNRNEYSARWRSISLPIVNKKALRFRS